MNLFTWIESWLSTFNIGTESSTLLARAILAVAVVVIAIVAFQISRRIARSVVHRVIERTKTAWDNHLSENRFFMRLTLIVPAIIIHLFLPMVFKGYDQAIAVAEGALNIFFIVVGALVVDALINALHDIYQTFRVSREIPLKGFSQVLKIILYCTALIMAVAVVLDRSPIYLLSGLGALTAGGGGVC
jgi:miniconductance mechanosensitive channel